MILLQIYYQSYYPFSNPETILDSDKFSKTPTLSTSVIRDFSVIFVTHMIDEFRGFLLEIKTKIKIGTFDSSYTRYILS